MFNCVCPACYLFIAPVIFPTFVCLSFQVWANHWWSIWKIQLTLRLIWKLLDERTWRKYQPVSWQFMQWKCGKKSTELFVVVNKLFIDVNIIYKKLILFIDVNLIKKKYYIFCVWKYDNVFRCATINNF